MLAVCGQDALLEETAQRWFYSLNSGNAKDALLCNRAVTKQAGKIIAKIE